MPDEFLTVDEVAKLLKLNQQTVRNQIDRGEMPAVRIRPRRVRIRRSELEAFLEAGSTGARPGPEAAEVDEHSVAAWATFGAAMADMTAALETTERTEIVRALYGLANAGGALADALQDAGE